MPTQHFRDAFVSLNGVDLSDHVRSVTLNYEAEVLDETAMGATTRKHRAGLLNWSAEIEFFHDDAAGEVGATLFPLVGADAFAIILRADNASGVSATNPNYTGDAIITTTKPMGGAVGEMHMEPVTLVPGGANNTLTRATA